MEYYGSTVGSELYQFIPSIEDGKTYKVSLNLKTFAGRVTVDLGWINEGPDPIQVTFQGPGIVTHNVIAPIDGDKSINIYVTDDLGAIIDDVSCKKISVGAVETLGDELVPNGTFDGNADGWDLGSRWVYNDNDISFINEGDNHVISPVIDVIVEGKTYRISFDISLSEGSGSVIFAFYPVLGEGPVEVNSSVGHYSGDFVALHTLNGYQFQITGNEDYPKDFTWGHIDNVSIKEVISTPLPEPELYIPETGAEVFVDLNDERIYGGVIVQVAQTDEWGLISYKVTCKDFSYELDRLLVTKVYDGPIESGDETLTLSALVLDLIHEYAPTFTTNNVQGAYYEIEKITFNKLTLSQCLEKICRLTGYNWYVDYDKDVHFFANNEETAPFNLEADSDNYDTNSLAIKDDISQLRNRVTIRGGEAIGEERTEKIYTKAGVDTYPLANKFSAMPVVTVGGAAITVGADYLANEDANVAMWSFQQKYLRFTANNIPVADGVEVLLTSTPLYPIAVQISDRGSIADYGAHEFYKYDDAVKTRADAIKYAYAELSAYADKLVTGSFSTTTPGLRSGQTINISIPDKGISDDYIIQSVRFTQSLNYYKWAIELASLKTQSLTDILRKLLLDEKLSDGEETSVLEMLAMSDAIVMSDSIADIIPTATEDYVWESDPETGYPNPIVWDEFTWAGDDES
jgi:hypothetical protein